MIALFTAQAALAFEWDHAEAPLTDQMTFHLCTGDFTADEEDRILYGMNGWQAGDGQLLRGATWTYLQGPDRPEADCEPGNGLNEIYAEDEDWFADHDSAGAIATTMNDDVAVSAEVDIIFNTADAGRWSALRPSLTADGEISIGMVALHEFGHGLGFNHDNTVMTVMNSSYPNGGDLGGRYHPHDDDYAGLVAMRPGSSSGTNLMLGKFVEEPGDPGDSIELWDEATEAWTVCRDQVDAADGPEAIYAHLHDTSGADVRPLVVWNLSRDKRCFEGPSEYEVGREQPLMIEGAPTPVQPDVYDFGAVPVGDYWLCARIDADAAIGEIREADNTVVSQARVTVQDCP